MCPSVDHDIMLSNFETTQRKSIQYGPEAETFKADI